METKRPFQARSVNPLHEDTSEYKNFEPSSTPSEVKYPRVNYENMSPTRQLDPKGLWPNSAPQLNRGRSKPYRIPSRSSRDPEDRRVYEDRFRHRPDREPPRTERPSSSNSGYSFDPSYYDHNSCAGADSKKYGRNNSPSTPFTTRSSQRDKSNDPVSIDNSRSLNSGEFLTHNEASEFAPMDTTFSRIGDKEVCIFVR
ncbi:hypothetical protein K7432_009235 [Basidiobolus ranarum]|uniref:Uncharacterized protein n=1 Tax=Basidiobolus ranarum TaxID=34480 RepID=A0ABR2VXE4_9FUNG